MASPTVENYVKAVYDISVGDGGRRATTGALADAMNVSPGTVTSMLKTLSQAGLATYMPYEGVRLSESGIALALSVLRRHRLLELFFFKTLGLTWDQVHEDAEEMEHAISDFLIDEIDQYLGHPEVDPHGDPIPTRDGHMPRRPTRPLSTVAAGESWRVARVIDQSADFLRYLSEAGLRLETVGRVVANQPEAGILTVRVDDREITLAQDAARSVLVVDESD